MESFGSRLASLIKTLRVDKKDFAEAGGIKPSTITGYTKDTSQPSSDVLSKWIREYGFDANWLLTGKGTMFPEESPRTTGVADEAERIAALMEKYKATPAEILAEIKKIVAAGTKPRNAYPDAGMLREPTPTLQEEHPGPPPGPAARNRDRS